jgi:ketosteroid isomerase-like protein
MKRLLILILLIFLFCLGCQKTEEAAEKPVVDVEIEKQNVGEVVRNYHNAAASHNYQDIRDLCADDFILFQSGQVMNLEEYINYIKRFEGATMTFDFEDEKINIEDSVAWVMLKSRAKMIMEEQAMDLAWLNSAVLKKKEGLWKIIFFHSTDAITTSGE